MTEYGRNYVLGVPLENVDRTLAAVPRFSADDLRAVARRYLAGENYVYAAVRGKLARPSRAGSPGASRARASRSCPAPSCAG